MLFLMQLVLFLAGHASGSLWSVIGAYRAVLVLVSFAVPALLALLSVVIVSGGASFSGIVAAQGGAPWHWLVFNHPPTILAFFVMASSLALWNLSQPFDTSLAGSEINGGISAEYSGFRLACLRVLRHCQTIISCALLVTLFLGGWNIQLPMETFGRASNLVQYLVFVTKVALLVVTGVWFRWSMVRLRGDQIVYHAWKILVPMGVISVSLSAAWMAATGGKGFLEIP
jgi:NADH-quinone oxidoreductase subunit H